MAKTVSCSADAETGGYNVVLDDGRVISVQSPVVIGAEWEDEAGSGQQPVPTAAAPHLSSIDMLDHEMKDRLAAKNAEMSSLNDKLSETLKDREERLAAKDEEIDVLTNRINSAEAQLTVTRQGLERATQMLQEARDALSKATNPNVGVVHPQNVNDLPTLDNLPVHKPLDENAA